MSRYFLLWQLRVPNSVGHLHSLLLWRLRQVLGQRTLQLRKQQALKKWYQSHQLGNTVPLRIRSLMAYHLPSDWRYRERSNYYEDLQSSHFFPRFVYILKHSKLDMLLFIFVLEQEMAADKTMWHRSTSLQPGGGNSWHRLAGNCPCDSRVRRESKGGAGRGAITVSSGTYSRQYASALIANFICHLLKSLLKPFL